MSAAPATWTALCAVAFILGARHGLDDDHLATIDALSRYNARTNAGIARLAGALFSLGHGIVVVGVAVVAGAFPVPWQTPAWLKLSGAAVSVFFLFALALLNVRAVLASTSDAVVVPAGLKARLLRRVLTVRRPSAIAAVGMLFGLSFDTVSQAALLALAARPFGDIPQTLAVAGLFVFGMLLVDAVNGAWILAMIRRADRAAVIASRVMVLAVAAVSLAVGALGVAKLLLPAVDTWSETHELWLGASVVAAAAAAFVVAMLAARGNSDRIATIRGRRAAGRLLILLLMNREQPTIGEHIARSGLSRRDFLLFCGKLMVAAPLGLALTSPVRAADGAREVAKARRLPVIWLHFQDCTGCTETLLRTSAPDLAELIFHVISLDYHETLMAAAGHAAEAALRKSITENADKYVLVVEGSIPRKGNGAYMSIAGRPALDMLEEVAARAAAVIAIGSCASWGGIASADPDPTGAVGVDEIVKGKPIVNLPGCPPNPYNLLGTVLQYARYGRLPELDAKRRPKFAYDRNIHDHCPRRAHFDAGRFARAFGDTGHRNGWCLYKLGCKGPDTHAGCATRQFNEVVDAWPIGVGAPCIGCTEESIAFRVPIFNTIPIRNATPPDTYAPIDSPQGAWSLPAALGVGSAAGALAGAAYVASRKFSTVHGDERVPGDDSPTDAAGKRGPESRDKA